MNQADSIFQLIYVSTAAIEFGTADLIKLLIEARDFNRGHQITGILIFENEKFLQVLEGDMAEVKQLYESICRDGRHDQIEAISSKMLSKREYPNWSMAFADSGALKSSSFRGFDSSLNKQAHTNTSDVLDKAHQLLKEHASFLM
jgi:Sensors of blue-light using FAD